MGKLATVRNYWFCGYLSDWIRARQGGGDGDGDGDSGDMAMRWL